MAPGTTHDAERPVPSRRAAEGRDSRAYLPALTGVRTFAAFLVLILHGNQNFPSYVSTGVDLLHRGYLGVDLFFILSGYIISHVYLGKMSRLRAAAVGIFLWHRFIRLFPAHAAVLIVLVAIVLAAPQLGIALNSKTGWEFRDLPWHFLLLHAWGTTETASWNAPSWSISAEWFAYLLFPALAFALLRLPRRAALALAPVALVATVLGFEAWGWRLKDAWVGEPALARVAGEFLCGALLYRAAAFASATPVSARLADGLGLTGILGFLLAAHLGADDLVLVGFLALLILGVSAPGPALRALFARRPVVWLGEISYSIYIVHFPLLLVLRRSAEGIGLEGWSAGWRVVAFLAAIAIVIAAAAVLFYLVESPARRRLRDAFGTLRERALPAALSPQPTPARPGRGTLAEVP